MTELDRVERVVAPLRRQVLQLIRQDILNFSLRPNSRLVERELCERYGVSRPVVREALRSLESEGLVQVIPNKGPIVASITVAEARSVYEVRMVLEGLAGKLCAERATDATIMELAAIVERLDERTRLGDMNAVLATKNEFYEALFKGTMNDAIPAMLRSLHARVTLMRALSLRVAGRGEQSRREIHDILDAVRSRDQEAAWTACVTHVSAAERAAMSELHRLGIDDDATPLANVDVLKAAQEPRSRDSRVSGMPPLG